MSSKKKALLCTLVSTPGPVVIGSKKEACEGCGELVWVSPSSEAIIEAHPDIEVLCLECVVSRMEESGEVRIVPRTKEQENEHQTLAG